MEVSQTISFDAKRYNKFSSLIFEYLNQNKNVDEFYGLAPNENSLIQQAQKKLKNYTHREITHQVIAEQMKQHVLSEKQKENLKKFEMNNTVTITTGHQLNLFTGPLYFFYKILQTIKCAEWMNEQHSEINFVPIFWMATEDHDFEEINHFYFKNKKFSWDRTFGDAVGRMDLQGIEQVFEEFTNELNSSKNSQELKELIEKSYLSSNNLTEATQKLVQELFGEYGLLMLDADNHKLKELMVPAFEKDLVDNQAFEIVSNANEKLSEKNHKIQVNPREINLFYLKNGKRERIIKENNEFKLLESNQTFTQDEILKELNRYPERFSPNVILRPLYQETILPNIAYIGGSGEMAYWLQLKDFFETQNVLFPVLIVRNSLLILSEKQNAKLEKLGINYQDLFLSKPELIHQNIQNNLGVDIDFEQYENQLNEIFDELQELSVQTDISFSKMVNAQRKRQLNGFDKMKKRLIKAEKRRQSEKVDRIQMIYDEVYPHGNLQERIVNFSELYIEYGSDLIKKMYAEIQPINYQFTIKILA